ncbi:MAG: hypothetical protein WAW52_01055 [Methanothrix sp.]
MHYSFIKYAPACGQTAALNKECLQRMSELGYGYRFVSNSTHRCRSSVAERLQGLGYSVPARHIYTPPLAAIDHMKRSGKERCFLITDGDVHRDFEGAEIRAPKPGIAPYS